MSGAHRAEELEKKRLDHSLSIMGKVNLVPSYSTRETRACFLSIKIYLSATISRCSIQVQPDNDGIFLGQTGYHRLVL